MHKLATKILGSWISYAVGALVVAFVLWFVFIRPGQLKQEATEANADAAYSKGRTESGQDALETQGQVNTRNEHYEALTEQGNNGIRSAQGADAPVDRAVACASAHAQCMQRSYAGSEQCRTLLSSCS